MSGRLERLLPTPNTTAVTQETDRTYGKFKSQYRQNLDLLVDACVNQGKSVSVPQYKHGLLVFGGIDEDTKVELPSAFEIGFSRKRCVDSWTKIGAAPLTRKCLDDPQVRKSIDIDDDYAVLVNSVQEANDYSVYALTEAGYDGSALQALLAIKPEESRTAPITERMSRERIELLARANTHGKKFFATGGSHVCSDDFFKAQALLAREEEITEKEKLKKSLQQKAVAQEKGMAILVEKATCFESNDYKNLLTKELDILLNWYGIEKKGAKKADKVAQWKAIRAGNNPPQMANLWTAEDEEHLLQLKNKEIDMSETYLGRYAAIQKRNAVAAVLDFTDEEWESLKRVRDADATERSNGATSRDNNDNSGVQGLENGVIRG